LVVHRSADGSPVHEQADAIDEAAEHVERLRNIDGVKDIQIFRMEEISFGFRPYYKVELGSPEARSTERPEHAPAESDEGAPTAADPPAVDTQPAAEPLPSGLPSRRNRRPTTSTAANAPTLTAARPKGHRGLFDR
jgi:hypothetical protein